MKSNFIILGTLLILLIWVIQSSSITEALGQRSQKPNWNAEDKPCKYKIITVKGAGVSSFDGTYDELAKKDGHAQYQHRKIKNYLIYWSSTRKRWVFIDTKTTAQPYVNFRVQNEVPLTAWISDQTKARELENKLGNPPTITCGGAPKPLTEKEKMAKSIAAEEAKEKEKLAAIKRNAYKTAIQAKAADYADKALDEAAKKAKKKEEKKLGPPPGSGELMGLGDDYKLYHWVKEGLFWEKIKGKICCITQLAFWDNRLLGIGRYDHRLYQFVQTGLGAGVWKQANDLALEWLGAITGWEGNLMGANLSSIFKWTGEGKKPFKRRSSSRPAWTHAGFKTVKDLAEFDGKLYSVDQCSRLAVLLNGKLDNYDSLQGIWKQIGPGNERLRSITSWNGDPSGNNPQLLSIANDKQLYYYDKQKTNWFPMGSPDGGSFKMLSICGITKEAHKRLFNPRNVQYECSKGYRLEGGDSLRCYMKSKKPLTWKAAIGACKKSSKKYPATLAVVSSDTENDFARRRLGQTGWIGCQNAGGQTEEDGGKWTWPDGKTVDGKGYSQWNGTAPERKEREWKKGEKEEFMKKRKDEDDEAYKLRIGTPIFPSGNFCKMYPSGKWTGVKKAKPPKEGEKPKKDAGVRMHYLCSHLAKEIQGPKTDKKKAKAAAKAADKVAAKVAKAVYVKSGNYVKSNLKIDGNYHKYGCSQSLGDSPWYKTLQEAQNACNKIDKCTLLHDDHCDGKNYRLCTNSVSSVTYQGNKRACWWHPPKSGGGAAAVAKEEVCTDNAKWRSEINDGWGCDKYSQYLKGKSTKEVSDSCAADPGFKKNCCKCKGGSGESLTDKLKKLLKIKEGFREGAAGHAAGKKADKKKDGGGDKEQKDGADSDHKKDPNYKYTTEKSCIGAFWNSWCWNNWNSTNWKKWAKSAWNKPHFVWTWSKSKDFGKHLNCLGWNGSWCVQGRYGGTCKNGVQIEVVPGLAGKGTISFRIWNGKRTKYPEYVKMSTYPTYTTYTSWWWSSWYWSNSYSYRSGDKWKVYPLEIKKYEPTTKFKEAASFYRKRSKMMKAVKSYYAGYWNKYLKRYYRNNNYWWWAWWRGATYCNPKVWNTYSSYAKPKKKMIIYHYYAYPKEKNNAYWWSYGSSWWWRQRAGRNNVMKYGYNYTWGPIMAEKTLRDIMGTYGGNWTARGYGNNTTVRGEGAAFVDGLGELTKPPKMIANCNTQKLTKCLKCEKPYIIVDKKKKDKCHAPRIKYCGSGQQAWNVLTCKKCKANYLLDGTKKICDLKIDKCKSQKRTLCEACLTGYRLAKDKKKCILVPFPECTKRVGIACEKCNKGWKLTKKKDKCAAIPINDCSDQKKATCYKCIPGYTLANNTCTATPIQHCTNQIKATCKNCAQYYMLDKNKCKPAPIGFCKKQTGIRCWSCKKGYLLDDNRCRVVKIPYCEKQTGSECKKCQDGFNLRNNACKLKPMDLICQNKKAAMGKAAKCSTKLTDAERRRLNCKPDMSCNPKCNKTHGRCIRGTCICGGGYKGKACNKPPEPIPADKEKILVDLEKRGLIQKKKDEANKPVALSYKPHEHKDLNQPFMDGLHQVNNEIQEVLELQRRQAKMPKKSSRSYLPSEFLKWGSVMPGLFGKKYEQATHPKPIDVGIAIDDRRKIHFKQQSIDQKQIELQKQNRARKRSSRFAAAARNVTSSGAKIKTGGLKGASSFSRQGKAGKRAYNADQYGRKGQKPPGRG